MDMRSQRKFPGARPRRRVFQWRETAAMGIQHGLEIASADYKWISWSGILVFRNRQQRRLLAQAFNIRACRSFELSSELVQVHVVCERHAPGRESQDRRPV